MADQQPNQNSPQKPNPKLQQLLTTDEVIIDQETQNMLNNPLAHPQGLDTADQAFLVILMKKIDDGEINLYKPETLMNMAVYEKLDEQSQGKADFDAVNLLGTIREIRKLWNLGNRDSYQIENLTHQIRLTKERLEELGGDIYII